MGGNKQTRRRGADPAFPRLLGERLCLDFVNTIESPRTADRRDSLHRYADLVHWGHHAGILDATERDRLLVASAARPTEADAVFARALTLRQALTRLFGALTDGGQPAAADLRRLQAEYLIALDRGLLAPAADGGFAWEWGAADDALDRPLGAVARSAVAVLTEDDPARVKACPGANDCGWLFYDTSKNGSRRWCSMVGCGSRVKMRQLHARRRAAVATAGG
jgi:predicted RNA-binding Zn ribbon-like protein